MIIRATNKLLSISKIKPVKFSGDNLQTLPGEWYVNTVKTGHAGKLILLFFNNVAKMSILCQTKSLNKGLIELPIRAKKYLIRHGFESLIEKFDLNSDVQIYTTDSRITISHMNNISLLITLGIANSYSSDDIDYEALEDIALKYLMGNSSKRGHYETSLEILNRFKSEL